MNQKELTKYASGQAAISQAQGIDIAVITDCGKGRWEVWGVTRHTLADGCRLSVGPVAGPTVLLNLTNGANACEQFGPIVLDILDATHDIIIELAVATGGAETASATVYAQRVSPI